MNPDLSSQKRLPGDSPEPENHPKEQEMRTSEEPEAVLHEASSAERGSAESDDQEAVFTPKTAEHVDVELGVDTCQAVTGGLLLSSEMDVEDEMRPSEEPAVVSHEASLERGSAESDGHEAVTTPIVVFTSTAEHESDVDTCLAVQPDALLPAKSNEANDAKGCTEQEPAEWSVQVDWTVNRNEMPVKRIPGISDDKERCTSHEKAKCRCSQRTELYRGSCDDSIAPSGADCADEPRRAVEKSPNYAISSSMVKRPRLIWDPGVELDATIRSAQTTMTTTRWQQVPRSRLLVWTQRTWNCQRSTESPSTNDQRTDTDAACWSMKP